MQQKNMRLYLTPIPKLTYKLKLTPQARLSISILQLPLAKLRDFIKEEIEKNPLLDIENSSLPLRPGYNSDSKEKQDYMETLITTPITLQEHLIRQLRILADSDYERGLGELVIGNIDDDGYFRCTVEEVAKSAKAALSNVKKVLFLIQSFDPAGVGARDLRECLLLQIKAKGQESSLAGQIIDKYLILLERKGYGYIAKKLSVSAEEVKEAIRDIARLEPKPGRSFSAERPIQLIPDVILKENKQGYEIISNDWELPRLILNAKYKKMIRQKDTPKDVKEYLR